jgi:Ca2+-binding EF-hand superfamily protein
MELKGGVEELWSSVYDLMDADANGHIDIHEFLLANSIASTGTIETKVGWMFSLFDEDKSGTLEENEVKNCKPIKIINQ